MNFLAHCVGVTTYSTAFIEPFRFTNTDYHQPGLFSPPVCGCCVFLVHIDLMLCNVSVLNLSKRMRQQAAPQPLAPCYSSVVSCCHPTRCFHTSPHAETERLSHIILSVCIKVKHTSLLMRLCVGGSRKSEEILLLWHQASV